MTSKPTLGSLLINPQKEDKIQHVSHEKIYFPKINLKLKKTNFTKYRSAFIDLQPQESDDQSRLRQIMNQNSRRKDHSKKLFRKLNTESIQKEKSQQLNKSIQRDKSQDLNAKRELKGSLWKLNKKCDQSYTIETGQTLNLHQKSASKGSNFHQNTSRRDKLIEAFLNQSQIKKNQKAALLTQIRQLNISPIPPLQEQKYQAGPSNRHKEINQKIEKSNRIISLIEKNHKKGFFQTNNKDSSLQKLTQRLGLFSYLKRQFVTNRQQLTASKLNDYFKSPSNTKLEAKINYNTRQFLKDKLHNDYHSYKEVHMLRENLSTNAIKQEMSHKNKEFNEEYNKKYNVPYLSFLSLPKNLKMKVLEKMTKNTNRSVMIKASSKK